MPQGKNNKKKSQKQSNNKKKNKGKKNKNNVAVVSGGYLPSFDEIMNDYTVDDDGITLRRKGKIVLTIEKLYHVAISELLELQKQNKDNEKNSARYIENFDNPNIWLEKLKKVMLSKYDFGDDDTGDILNCLIDNSEEILSNNRVEEDEEENENGGGRGGGSNDDDDYNFDRGAQHNQL